MGEEQCGHLRVQVRMLEYWQELDMDGQPLFRQKMSSICERTGQKFYLSHAACDNISVTHLQLQGETRRVATISFTDTLKIRVVSTT